MWVAAGFGAPFGIAGKSLKQVRGLVGCEADCWDSVADEEEPVEARLKDHRMERDWAEAGIEGEAPRAMCTYSSLQHVQQEAFCDDSSSSEHLNASTCSPNAHPLVIGSLSFASASVHVIYQIVHQEHEMAFPVDNDLVMPR